MLNVPVIFEFENKEYFAELHKVSGSGAHGSYHLMSNNFYSGHLFYSEHYGWLYHGSTFEGFADQLSEFITENKEV